MTRETVDIVTAFSNLQVKQNWQQQSGQQTLSPIATGGLAKEVYTDGGYNSEYIH